MPIGGFVVSCSKEDRGAVEEVLGGYPPVSVEGSDDQGNIVVVMDTETSLEMDDLVKTISRLDGVFSVGLAYLHAEDEIERIASGELPAGDPFPSRKKRSPDVS